MKNVNIQNLDIESDNVVLQGGNEAVLVSHLISRQGNIMYGACMCKTVVLSNVILVLEALDIMILLDVVG